MLRHVDEKGGYVVLYPDDWQPVPSEEGSVRLVADPRVVAEPSPAAGAMVIILPGKLADIQATSGTTIRNSKELLDYTLEGLESQQQSQFGAMELFEANGLIFAAAEATYHDDDYNVDVRTWVAATVRGDRALIAVAGSPVEQWEGYQAALRRIVRTIRLL
jgi:hypothetical protein